MVSSGTLWGRIRPTTSRAVLILGGVIIAALLAMSGYEIWRQRQATLEAATQNLSALSLALTQQTERAFHSVELVMDSTAQSVQQAGGPDKMRPLDLHRELKARVDGIPQMIGVAVVDREGFMIAGALRYPSPKTQFKDRDIFVRHRADPSLGVVIGAPHASPVDGRPIIPVSRRLSGPDGSFQGIVLAAVDPEYFQQFYRRVLPSEDGAFALFRTDGILLARSPQSDNTVIGQSFAHLRIFQPDTGPQGLAQGPSPMDGAYRLLAYQRLSSYPLVINVSLRRDVLLAPWLNNAGRLGLAAVLAVLLVSLATAVLTRQSRHEEAHAIALEESERRLRFAQFALDHAADMVFWVDSGGRILYTNHAATMRLEYPPDALVGQPIATVDPRFTDRAWRRLLPWLKRRRRAQFRSVHRTRRGVPYPAEVSVNYVEFEGADFVCAFARDISQRKAAEAALAEKTAKLEASNAELEQFAYVASHDLREPLRMVNSFVTMLARRYGDSLNDEAKEFIGFAQDGAVRMDRLILDLLEYSRVGRLDRPLVPLPLARGVEAAMRSLHVAIAESGAQVEVVPELPVVMANEEELTRLFLNLIGNALKYHHPDRAPQVRVGAQMVDGKVMCWVTDNGIGIAPQYYDRVFRIFQRLHGRDRYEGTGIGLAICKKIVERHGGRIWIESTPDQGSTFFFTLQAGPALA
jgi:PAS domain S-box